MIIIVTDINTLLKNKHIKLINIAGHSGIAVSTLSYAKNQPVSSWKIKTLNAFADALHMTPPELLTKLENINSK